MTRAAFFAFAILAAYGCGPRWDVGAVADSQCRAFLGGLRGEEKIDLDRWRDFLAETPKSANAKKLVEISEYDAAYSDDAFVAGCVAIATPEVQVCANEFQFGTDSADQCVKRRMREAKLGRVKRDAPRSLPKPF